MRFKPFALAAAVAAAALMGAAPATAATSDAVAEHFATATPLTSGGPTAQALIITEVQEGVRNPNKVAECYQAQGGNCTISQSVAIQAQSADVIQVQLASPKGVIATAPTTPVQKKLTGAGSFRAT